MDIRRILVTRLKYIGDVVLTTPILRSVRERYPDAFIAYLTDAKAAPLLERNPNLDEIIPYDFSRPSPLEQLRIGLRLRQRRFDAVVDLYSNPRSALLTWASGASIRIGRDVRGRGRVYTHRMGDFGSLTPAIEFHYQYFKPLSVDPRHWKTEIFLSDEERREARIYLELNGVDCSKPVVAVHPGATWPNKMWPKERFATLIDQLRAKSNVQVVVSPGPEDKALVEFISNASVAPSFVLPVLPLRQLAGILSLCNVFVTNDCGPMHIAVAVGCKTIGIFGPEPVNVWFPYAREDGHLPVYRDIECSPCRKTSCFRQGNDYLECMTLISVDEIVGEVKKRL